MQFVVESGAAIKPVLFLRTVLPLLLPEQILAEVRQKPAMVQIIVEEHGSVLLQLPQQLPGVAVAGENLGKLHIKGFKGHQI